MVVPNSIAWATSLSKLTYLLYLDSGVSHFLDKYNGHDKVQAVFVYSYLMDLRQFLWS